MTATDESRTGPDLANRDRTEIVIGHYKAVHHCYVIHDTIDGQKTAEQAQARAVDRYHPESTVIHYHRSEQSCNGQEHKKFEPS